MNALKHRFGGINRLFTFRRATAMIAVTVLFAGIIPAPVHAAGPVFGGRGVGPVRGFGPARGFGTGVGIGLGYGLGFGIGASLAYPYSYGVPYYYYDQPVIYSDVPSTVYYVQPSAPTVVVTPPAPAPVAPVAPVASTGPAAPAKAKTGQIVYDGNAKPIGVLVSKSDGSTEYVPLAQ
jgi:hypothetical protein